MTARTVFKRRAEPGTLLQNLFLRLLIAELLLSRPELQRLLPELRLLCPPESQVLSVPFSLGVLGFGLCFLDVGLQVSDLLFQCTDDVVERVAAEKAPTAQDNAEQTQEGLRLQDAHICMLGCDIVTAPI